MDNQSIRRLAVFAEVADAGSLSAAARRLGVTRSAVSQQIKALEEELGVRLLRRTTRSVGLTEVGRALLGPCRRLTEAADDARAVVASYTDEPAGTVVISAPRGPAEGLLAMVLPELLVAWPRLSVELRVEEGVVDLVAEGVDLVVRAGRVQSTLRGRRLDSLELLMVAAPAYLERRGTPASPEELHQHDWIGFSPIGPRFVLGGVEVRPTARMTVSDGGVLRRLLLRGAGLGLLPTFYVGDDLATGRLRRVLPEHGIPLGDLWVLHPFEGQAPPKVRVVIDALVAAA